MNLSEALQIRPGVTAIIGGGGKTTLMERLAHELSGKARVIVCTTTHIYPEKTMPCLVSPAQAEIAAALEKSPCICVGAWSENGKFGPPELPVGTLARLADYVIVEAEGAKRDSPPRAACRAGPRRAGGYGRDAGALGAVFGA